MITKGLLVPRSFRVSMPEEVKSRFKRPEFIFTPKAMTYFLGCYHAIWQLQGGEPTLLESPLIGKV
jgi:hypothetical protein